MPIYKVYTIGRNWSWPVMSAPACILLYLNVKFHPGNLSQSYYLWKILRISPGKFPIRQTLTSWAGSTGWNGKVKTFTTFQWDTSTNAHCTNSIVAVILKCIYLFFIIEIFQHNTHRLIYFEGLET